MTPEEDDLLGAEPLGGDDPAQPDCAVADYSRGLPWADFRSQSGMVARSHHVLQGEKRRHQRVVNTDRQDDERSVRLRDTHRLSLSSVDITKAVSASV